MAKFKEGDIVIKKYGIFINSYRILAVIGSTYIMEYLSTQGEHNNLGKKIWPGKLIKIIDPNYKLKLSYILKKL